MPPKRARNEKGQFIKQTAENAQDESIAETDEPIAESSAVATAQAQETIAQGHTGQTLAVYQTILEKNEEIKRLEEELRRKNADCIGKIATLQEEINQTKNSYDTFMAQHSTSNDDIEQKEQEIEALKKQHEEHERAIQQLQDEKNKLQQEDAARIDSLEKQLITEKENSENTEFALTEQNLKFITENETLQNTKNELTQQITELKTQLTILQNNDEKNTLADRIAELERKLNTITQQEKTCIEEKTKLNEKISEYETESIVLHAEQHRLTTEKTTNIAQIQSLQQQLTEEKQNEENYKTSLQEKETALASERTKNLILHDDNAKQSEKIQKLEEELAHASQASLVASAGNTDEVKNLQNELDKEKAECAENLKNQNDAWEQKLKIEQEKIKEEEKQLEALTNEIKNLTIDADESRKENNKLKQEKEECEAKIAKLSAEHATALHVVPRDDAEIARLQNEINNLRVELAQKAFYTHETSAYFDHLDNSTGRLVLMRVPGDLTVCERIHTMPPFNITVQSVNALRNYEHIQLPGDFCHIRPAFNYNVNNAIFTNYGNRLTIPSNAVFHDSELLLDDETYPLVLGTPSHLFATLWRNNIPPLKHTAEYHFSPSLALAIVLGAFTFNPASRNQSSEGEKVIARMIEKYPKEWDNLTSDGHTMRGWVARNVSSSFVSKNQYAEHETAHIRKFSALMHAWADSFYS